MADNNTDKKSSRTSKILKGIGKAAFYSTPAGMTYGAGKIIRNKTAQESAGETNLSPENTQSAQEATLSDPSAGTTSENVKTPSRFKDAAKKTAKGAGKVYMYTSPGAFIVGKLLEKRGERVTAQKEVEEIEKTSREKARTPLKPPAFVSKSAKKTAKGITKTSAAYWIHKLSAKYFPTQTQTFDNFFTKRGKKKTTTTNAQERKSEIDYVKSWNKKTLAKTEPQRAFIKDNLQKFFKTKAWKYGKYVVSPGGAITHNLYQRIPKKEKEQEKTDEGTSFMRPFGNKKQENPKPNIPGKFQKYIKSGGKTIYKYTTPAGQAQAAWNKWGKPRTLSLNNRLGRRFGNVASPRRLGSRAAKKLGSQLGKTAIKQVVLTFFKTPPGWVTLGVIALVFLFFGAMVMITTALTGGGGGNGSQIGSGGPVGGNPAPPNNPIPGLTLTLSGDASVPNSSEITYTVTVTYDETLLPAPVDSINIVNVQPVTTRFLSTTGVTSSTAGGTAVWPLSSPENRSKFSFKLTPVQDNIIVNTSVYATLSVNSSQGGSATPTSTNCNGVYTLDNPIGNFGDPDCFVAQNNAQAKSEMYALLKSLDPVHADGWFLKVIPCESIPSYNPNSHSAQAAIGSPDAAGVWGLFSMGRGLNGEYDHGDVPWRDQISNAVNYGKILTSNGLALGEYWQCWR